jgi:hypothetical protein
MGKWVVSGVALALLLVTAWRVHGLAADVERISAAAPAAPAEAGAERTSQPEVAAPTLAAPAPETALPAPARVDELVAAVGRLEKRVGELERQNEAVKDVLAEIAAARMRANETAAIATARNSISAAAQFQASAKADVDEDGTGEYGGFREMSGAVRGRMPRELNPPVLSGAFRELSEKGEAQRSGYLYRIFLPDARGVGVGEPARGFEPSLIDADLAETTWCLYAWPLVYGETGTKTYFTNQGGDVLWTDCPSYSGSGAGPASDAAFVKQGSIMGAVAFGTGSDANVWKQAN